jgi:hypothetical protein
MAFPFWGLRGLLPAQAWDLPGKDPSGAWRKGSHSQALMLLKCKTLGCSASNAEHQEKDSGSLEEEVGVCL